MLPALITSGIAGLIFGGCCSNVYTLETILRQDKGSGHLITFSQFLVIVLAVWPFQIDVTQPFWLKKTSAPIQRWIVTASLFMIVNILNNWAFAFNISVPVHIILRSFGSVTTMAAGWLRGKKYSFLQVLSVFLLTGGVLISAWADSKSKVGKPKLYTEKPGWIDPSMGAGLVILLAAQIISAFMSIYVEETYRAYGKDWQDAIFYNHLLSLPFFTLFFNQLMGPYRAFALAPPLVPSSSLLPSLVETAIRSLPGPIFMLLLNGFTQLVCLCGVNILSANTSAVTVTIVLNIRKLVSFLISIVVFGNKLSPMMSLGAALVFGSGALYGWETSIGIPARRALQSENGSDQKVKSS